MFKAAQDALKERDDELEQKEGELADLMQQLAENAEQIKVLGAQIDQEREKSRSLFKQVKVWLMFVSMALEMLTATFILGLFEQNFPETISSSAAGPVPGSCETSTEAKTC